MSVSLPRAFLTSMPKIQIFDTTPTLKMVMSFSELDNQPQVRFRPVPIYQCAEVVDTDGVVTDYLKGYRPAGRVDFQVWPQGHCVETRQAPAKQVTEWEIAQILDAKFMGWHVQFWPHADQCLGAYDAKRDIRVIDCYADRTSEKQYPCAGVLEFEYVNLIATSNDIWAYLSSL